MTAARKRQNAALLPTCRQLVDLHRRGVRGPTWQKALARLATTVALLEDSTDA